MFIVATLKNLHKNLADAGVVDLYKATAENLCAEVEKGINEFAVVETEKGKVYAYEVDGLGNKLMMDDANVPSLLAMPYMGYCDKTDDMYLRTRDYVLSKSNPYYFEGSAAKGIGSPHTPENYIWHIGLLIEGLTTDDRGEIERIYNTLLSTDAGTGFMHEGFNCDNPDEFTRSWFAWANTLFAIFMMDKII